MLQYPTTPHDWALWLFEKLEQLEDTGDRWEGLLPKNLNFDEVVGKLPESLRGVCDADRRTIEFHPAVVGVFNSMTELVGGWRRRNVPKIFTIRDLDYTHGCSNSRPVVVERYLGAVKLWQRLACSADHIAGQGHSLFFIKTFESKVELRCEYTVSDLRTLDRLDEFAANYFDSDHHRDQKRTIIRNALLEIFKGKIVIHFSDILLSFQDFVERVRNAYTLYTTDFSFERLRLEVDKQNLEDILRLNKTFSDIQNQLLAIPAAMLLVGANVKTNNLAANVATIVGVSIFAWVMRKLICNQIASVDAIKEEINLREGKIKEQQADISTKLLPRFSHLRDRMKHQDSVLSGLQIAVAVVWISTVVIVLDAQWPELRLQSVTLVCKVVSNATAWLCDTHS